jgi:hypothetical protein
MCFNLEKYTKIKRRYCCFNITIKLIFKELNYFKGTELYNDKELWFYHFENHS